MIFNFTNDDLKLWNRAKAKLNFKFGDHINNSIKK
jgi:hypothetical protein